MPHALALRPNRMELDLSALDHNYRLLLGRLKPGTRIIASVKAGAYGLGVVDVARRLTALGVPALATGSYEDARAIRAAGLDTEIVMFGGVLPEGIPDYLDQHLIPTAHTIEIARAVSDYAKAPAKVYIKVDCGWGRLGVPVRYANAFVKSVAALPNVIVDGLYTHLPFGDRQGLDWARERMALFDALIAGLEADGISIPVTQSRSSAGILAGIEDRCTAVSPGGFLYGKSPLNCEFTDQPALRPVMKRIVTRLIHISPDAADRTPGLESRYASQVSGATGVVPFGRADGNRMAIAGQQAHMLIGGRKAPVLGVSSEHAVVDMSATPEAKIGDEVIILGESGGEVITLSDLASWQGTTGSDILLMMSGRMMRRLVG